jgi:hypothetical protein
MLVAATSRLGLADLVGSEGLSLTETAAACCVAPRFLERLLLCLRTIGIFDLRDGQVVHTGASLYYEGIIPRR